MIDTAIEPTLKAGAIASGGGLLRYLSMVLQGRVDFKIYELLLWIIVAGLTWLLAFWLTEWLFENHNYQLAVIYTAWLLSNDLIKIIVIRVPILVDKYIIQKWANISDGQ